MKKLIHSYSRLSQSTKIGLQALVTALIAYATALLSVQIAIAFSIGSAFLIIFHAIVAIVLIAIIVFASLLIRGFAEALEAGENRKARALAFDHTMTDNWITQNIEHLGVIGKAVSDVKQVYVPHDPLYSIRLLVHSLYETLEAHFSQAEHINERIEFEVTFMTRSYLDGKITVAAWANRDGRMPTSLSIRQDDPNIYDRTITAKLYLAQRPFPRVIPDTFDPHYEYSELYDHERDRIRSSIVYPVLSDQNRLIGTLVAHCDKPNFFQQSDLKYWREILEIFAKRIALEKLRLDQAINNPSDKQISKGLNQEQILHPF